MRRLASDYGIVLVLLLLCATFSVLTYKEQAGGGAEAGPVVVRDLVSRFGITASVLIASGPGAEDVAFATAVRDQVSREGGTVVEFAVGEPRDARKALERISRHGERIDAVICPRSAADWLVFSRIQEQFPQLGSVEILSPRPYWWPNFLKRSNLLNIANQIAVIAIVAVGMTMVIVTGGIDLSVGSLIALSAVVSALAIRNSLGGTGASPAGMIAGSLAGIAVCTLVGLITGILVTSFGIPPFIVTLATMLVASGVALQMTSGESVYQIPETFVWLGRGADILGIPNAVVLMLALYAAAGILMARTTLGRYLYAVGGNPEAARLSGVPVSRVLVFAYAACGALAGLGGVVMASQLKSGSPNYGQMYELYTIAAVVVGGTSLSGGEGRMSGTLVGAFIIAVIQNGMNLTGIEPYTQKVVLGLVILAAVLLDRLKSRRAGA